MNIIKKITICLVYPIIYLRNLGKAYLEIEKSKWWVGHAISDQVIQAQLVPSILTATENHPFLLHMKMNPMDYGVFVLFIDEVKDGP